MDKDTAIKIARGCVMSSMMDNETKKEVLDALVDAEIARQSVKSEEVSDAIEEVELMCKGLKEMIPADAKYKWAKEIKAYKTALTALRQMRTEPDCSNAEWTGGKCNGYGKGETDDEPIEVCKNCEKHSFYGIE